MDCTTKLLTVNTCQQQLGVTNKLARVQWLQTDVASQKFRSTKFILTKICKWPIHENFVPRKFGAIQYVAVLFTCSNQGLFHVIVNCAQVLHVHAHH